MTSHGVCTSRVTTATTNNTAPCTLSKGKDQASQPWDCTHEVTTTAAGSRNNNQHSLMHPSPDLYRKRGSSLLELNRRSFFTLTALRRCHDLPISCVEIDYLLIQFKIMFHLNQRFHIQINEICLQKECAV